MGHVRAPSLHRHVHALPWPRSRRRRWVREADVSAAEHILAMLPSLPRAELSRLTERLIDRMDELDGDPDLEATGEDDEPEEDVDAAHDDGCGPVYLDGRRVWGSREEGLGRTTPVYGIDQTRGPINDYAARQWFREQEKRHE